MTKKQLGKARKLRIAITQAKLKMELENNLQEYLSEHGLLDEIDIASKEPTTQVNGIIQKVQEVYGKEYDR